MPCRVYRPCPTGPSREADEKDGVAIAEVAQREREEGAYEFVEQSAIADKLQDEVQLFGRELTEGAQRDREGG